MNSSNHKQSRTGFFKPVLASILLAASSPAAVIVNSSFENDVVADGGFTTNVSGWAKEGAGTIGSRNPDNSDYNGTNGAGAIAGMSGPQVLSITQTFDPLNALLGGPAAITQSTGLTITLGTTYTLTAAIGNPANVAGLASGYISLYTGSNTLAFAGLAGVTLLDGSFQTLTATYTPQVGDAALGQTLNLRLGVSTLVGTATSRVDFDNVTLAAVPEPSTIALLGLAGPGIWIWRARRRQARS